MKKNELLSIWAPIKGAKFGKLSGEAKVKYVQMFAKLSPVVKDFESYRDTISEKLMSEHDGFKDKLQEAELPDIRFHDLRHTNATLMLRNGIPAKVVSAMLGHSSIQLTMDTFSYVLPDMKEGAVSAMDKLLDGLW